MDFVQTLMQNGQTRLGKTQKDLVVLLAITKFAMALNFLGAMIRIVRDDYSVAGLFARTHFFIDLIAVFMVACFVPVCVSRMQAKLLLNRELYPCDRDTVFACVMDFILHERIMFYLLAIGAAVAFAGASKLAVPLMIGALACIAIQLMNWLRDKFVARLPGLEYQYEHIE